MGSNKKNTSKSKAGTQSAERVAAPDVELKVSEDVAAEPMAVCSETPGTKTPAAEMLAAETPAQSTASNEIAAVEYELFSKNESTEQKPAAPNLSLHASAIPLSLKPEMSVDWPLSRRRQLFNVVYFGLVTFQLWVLTHTGVGHWAAYLGLFVCGLLATASVFYLFNHRHHQTSSEEFSPRMRRSLRAAGLLVPAFLMFAMVKSQPPASSPPTADFGTYAPPPAIVGDNFAFNGEMALGKDAYKRHRYSEAIEHFQKASAIAPQSDLPFEWMAQTNDSRFDFNSAIGNALTTIKINPENENAHLILGHGYVMTGREREAVAILERAKELNPSDGEAYGYLSRAYSAIGNYDKALINDNSHVQIHWYEQRAFLQRADTLDALGRANEARYVRQLAEQVRQSTHH